MAVRTTSPSSRRPVLWVRGEAAEEAGGEERRGGEHGGELTLRGGRHCLTLRALGPLSICMLTAIAQMGSPCFTCGNTANTDRFDANLRAFAHDAAVT